MSKNVRKDNFKRKSPYMPIRDRVLIMCGGQTEKIYFENFKLGNKVALENVDVRVIKHGESNPMAIVKAVLRDIGEYDERWAVFDKDEFKDFDKAIEYAKNNGIRCAFSNEAIEYWFYLHFENKTGAISRDALSRELGKLLGVKYDKGEKVIKKMCDRIYNNLKTAEERAKVGHQKHMRDACNRKPSAWYSCTTVYELTKRLREWGEV